MTAANVWRIESRIGLGLYRRARILAVLCLFGLAVPLLVRHVALDASLMTWLLDLISHWQGMYAIGLLLCTGFAACHDRRWLAALPCAALPLLTAAPAAPTSTHTNPQAPTLRIASANVHLDNTDPHPLAQWLSATQPDVVVLVELSPGFAQGLKAIAGYPHRITHPRDDPFGLGVLSRHPLQSVQLLNNPGDTPLLRTVVQARAVNVHLSAAHPMPPISREDFATRNAMLRRETQYLKNTNQPAILAGDLNASVWSSAFAGDTLGLQRTCGMAPTWPAALGGFLGIPIDHILASHHWQVVECAVGPHIGSDHLPILVSLHIQ